MMTNDLKRKLIAIILSSGGAIGLAQGLVRYFEGHRNMPYQDTGGKWTVCEGHTRPEVKPGKVYTEQECEAFKDHDLIQADQAITRLVHVPLTIQQRAALIDFTFNEGPNNLAHSTLLKKFNAGDYQGGCRELSKWIKARKAGMLVVLPGLVNRREVERALCSNAL